MQLSSEKMSALGDPTRRQILELLTRAPSSVGDIARQLPVSRPAVSQHLKVLKDVGLVVHHADGARHFYRVDPAGLAALRRYMDSLWERALEQLKREAERPNQTRRKAQRKRK